MFKNIKMKKVTRHEVEGRGLVWPLTVDSGLLLLRIPEKAVCFHDFKSQKMYALNGIARMAGIENITPLWAENMDLTDLINEGLAL